MSEFQPYQVLTSENVVRQINARPVAIEGFEEFCFFVHTDPDGDPWYVITEASSGLIITTGLKWYDAVNNAEKVLHTIGKDLLQAQIKNQIAKTSLTLNQ